MRESLGVWDLRACAPDYSAVGAWKILISILVKAPVCATGYLVKVALHNTYKAFC